MLQNYFLAIEHHIKTGENVTVENFKSIKKQYQQQVGELTSKRFWQSVYSNT